MNSWTPEEVQKTLEIIKGRITTDEEFRRFCLENPHAAIKELSGKDLPTGLQVDFSENGEVFLIIEESAAKLPDGELSDQELELVSGGLGNNADIKAWWHVVSPKRTKVRVDMPTGVAGIRA